MAQRSGEEEEDEEEYQSNERASLMPGEENADDEDAPTDDLGVLIGETPFSDRKLFLENISLL
jgi:hypothetical protein